MLNLVGSSAILIQNFWGFNIIFYSLGYIGHWDHYRGIYYWARYLSLRWALIKGKATGGRGSWDGLWISLSELPSPPLPTAGSRGPRRPHQSPLPWRCRVGALALFLSSFRAHRTFSWRCQFWCSWNPNSVWKESPLDFYSLSRTEEQFAPSNC